MFSIGSKKEDFPPRSGKKFKVVVNSGGGVFGYIISNFMSYLNFDLYSKIDLAAGTSIGGILALAYSVQNKYEWINKLFKAGMYEIFSNKKSKLLNSYSYENTNLKKFLAAVFGDKKLSDLKNKVLITTTDFTLGLPRIFENFHLKDEQDISLIDLGLYTSAAPTFFQAHSYPWKMLEYQLGKIPLNEKILISKALSMNTKTQESVLFDGGILENIPIMSAYAVLHNEMGAAPEDIDMLVIGAGDKQMKKDFTVKDANHWSVLEVLNNLIVPYVTKSNEQTSIYWGLQMGFNRFKYFNPISVNGDLDNLKMIPVIEEQCKANKEQFINEVEEFLNA